MFVNILLVIYRAIARFFAKLRGLLNMNARTAGKSGSSYTAKQLNESEHAHGQYNNDELPTPIRDGAESLIFKQLSRPRLSERTAADLTLEEARYYMQQSDIFYTYPFELFARSDFFYEEVEEEFLNNALGLKRHSIDERFLKIIDMFKRTLNDNTRKLMIYIAPLTFFTALLGATFMALNDQNFLSLFLSEIFNGQDPQLKLAFGISAHSLITFGSLFGVAILFAFLFILLLFSWPFKVSQQRNLLNLDNYITSKFARINNNFQVAKRRALNVERNKRMSQAEELKEEAGIWTMSYQWFAMRLMLCELMIRNRLYQVRRNTTLYWLSGLGICATIMFLFLVAINYFIPAERELVFAIVLSSLVYILLTFLALQRTTYIMLSVLEANEWSRFHMLDLHNTIQDHAGEDKVQIVTFRDRNRLE